MGKNPPVTVPWYLYVLLLLPPVVVAVALWTSFDALPDPLPTHWGFSGEPDAWEPKSMRTLLVQLLLGPGIMLFGMVLTSTFLWLQSTDADERTWHGMRAGAPVIGWYLVLLSLSVTVMLLGSYGPWAWLQGSGGWLNAAGLLGLVASTVWLLVVLGRQGRRLAENYPHPDGRRTRWLMFVEVPGNDSVMVDTGSGSNFTFNVATRGGRIGAVVLLAVLAAGAVMVVAMAVAAL